jgi:hypothetical protein
MTEREAARGVGLYSLGIGTVFCAMPARMSRLCGMGVRPRLMLYFGVRDLVLASGLLASAERRPWLLARAVADASDAGIMTTGLLSGRFSPRALPLLSAALGSSALALALARRLEGE